MKTTRPYIVSAVLVGVFAAGIVTITPQPTNALSLNDVTNAVGGLLGINQPTQQQNNNTTTPVAQPTSQPVTQAQPSTSAQTSAAASPQTATAQVKPQSVPATTAVNTTPSTATLAQARQIVQPGVAADSSSVVKQIAALQTDRTAIPVTYSSTRISTQDRNQLLAVALSIVIIGTAMYGMTTVTSRRTATVPARRPLFVK